MAVLWYFLGPVFGIIAIALSVILFLAAWAALVLLVGALAAAVGALGRLFDRLSTWSNSRRNRATDGALHDAYASLPPPQELTELVERLFDIQDPSEREEPPIGEGIIIDDTPY